MASAEALPGLRDQMLAALRDVYADARGAGTDATRRQISKLLDLAQPERVEVAGTMSIGRMDEAAIG